MTTGEKTGISIALCVAGMLALVIGVSDRNNTVRVTEGATGIGEPRMVTATDCRYFISVGDKVTCYIDGKPTVDIKAYQRDGLLFTGSDVDGIVGDKTVRTTCFMNGQDEMMEITK